MGLGVSQGLAAALRQAALGAPGSALPGCMVSNPPLLPSSPGSPTSLLRGGGGCILVWSGCSHTVLRAQHTMLAPQPLGVPGR